VVACGDELLLLSRRGKHGVGGDGGDGDGGGDGDSDKGADAKAAEGEKEGQVMCNNSVKIV
jgi:hypothetical protein